MDCEYKNKFCLQIIVCFVYLAIVLCIKIVFVTSKIKCILACVFAFILNFFSTFCVINNIQIFLVFITKKMHFADVRAL